MSNTANNILEVGMVLNDKWVIIEVIGRGAMGEVYRAHQLALNRDVAIKVISRDLLQGWEGDEEDIQTAFQRFRREVQAMAKTRHPNVLEIFDYGSTSVKKAGEDVAVEYIAMEFIPGDTLRSTMSEDGFYPEEELTEKWLLDYFFPVLDGVQAMHGIEMVHRDLKPENVLLDGNTPKIADFGLARSCRLKSVTQSMDTKGTAPYMSPEQFVDFKRADLKADIYSLGKILFEAVSGKISSKTIPFKSVGLEKADTPFFEKLDRIVRKATSEDRKERFESVVGFRDALEEAIGTLEERKATDVSKPARSYSFFAHPKWIWTGIAVAVISVGLMAIWHLLGEPGKSTPTLKGPQIIGRDLAQPKPYIPSETALESTITPAPTLHGKDEVTLHFVPGGNISLPENFGLEAGKQVKVDPFYMDETKVTNHQYVLFLNQVIPRITAEKGVVQGDGDIWLLLGEVKEGYEPVIFRDDKFVINDAMHAACPVLRVTGYGASAYARFYGKRLQNQTEWLYALVGTPEPKKKAAEDGSESSVAPDVSEVKVGMLSRTPVSDPMSETLPIPSPVMLFKPNSYGIRGLNRNASEWGLRILSGPSAEKMPAMEYVVLGGLGSDSEKEHGLPAPVARYPWEAFEEVGFRCVQNLS